MVLTTILSCLSDFTKYRRFFYIFQDRLHISALDHTAVYEATSCLAVHFKFLSTDFMPNLTPAVSQGLLLTC